MAVTRTLGPLHLEDLEPHRFEDLIRQLLYDFRPWRRLEPTGRGGTDDGFDVRGWEIVDVSPDERDDLEAAAEQGEGAENSVSPAPTTDRIWLIQCKREKRIGPSDITTYLRDIPKSEVAGLYGIVFAAACDFSKKTHDAFRDVCLELGIAEWHLWGKAAIEDRLYLPANDHLLFAYFGVSLQIRKRSLKASLNARLAMKRKSKQHLSQAYKPVVILDATDTRYPYLDEDKTKQRPERGRRVVREIDEIYHAAIGVIVERQCAVLDENEAWDFAETMNIAKVNQRDHWRDLELSARLEQARDEAMLTWNEWPEDKRGWHEAIALLPFENILAIDPDGFVDFPYAHVYTTEWHPVRGPFHGWFRRVRPNVPRFPTLYIDDDTKGRMQVFKRKEA